VLIELIIHGAKPWHEIAAFLATETLVGALAGYFGGRAVVLVLNKLNLPQGLHAPFVATGAVVIFALADVGHGSGFLAVYVAGLVVGNSAVRAHNAVVTFLDAATWLAQIGMFVVLGLLAWPDRLPQNLVPALTVAAMLMLVARPAAVFLCLIPYRFSWRERAFMSWVGLRGAVGIFIASMPLLVGVPNGQIYFDVGFVVVLVSLLIQGWTIAPSARWLNVSFPRSDPLPRRIELDLPGQLEQELVGYPLSANSPYLRRGLLPNWARPTLVVRDERILSPNEAKPLREGDYIYLLAPPERAAALDRFFVDMPPPVRPDPLLLGDFFVTGDHTLGELAEIYGLSIAPDELTMSLADFIARRTVRTPRAGDIVPLGTIALVVQRVAEGRVANVGLRLADELEPEAAPATLGAWLKRTLQRLWARLG
jgi:cell volume regulation protein A